MTESFGIDQVLARISQIEAKLRAPQGPSALQSKALTGPSQLPVKGHAPASGHNAFPAPPAVPPAPRTGRDDDPFPADPADPAGLHPAPTQPDGTPSRQGAAPRPGAPAHFDFSSALQIAAGKSGMDADLLAAIVKVESNGNPRTRSHKGAMGLMQLMPETVKDYGVKDPFDPVDNMTGGGKYLRRMIKMFDGNLSHALAAYNAGEGAVSRHGGIPPYRETQAFVRKVLDIYGSNQP
jgi:soluble lytic murein transglycosylase